MTTMVSISTDYLKIEVERSVFEFLDQL